ncbi:GNAT family N-acetyltransferase [Streptomyces sp. t39]|uniref:GNAT family N-acetyltransferase n=1 Tax=Streptomyces sp. t39 TaxID=1828156 RepID=UPI0011CE0908|nr:GNAT family N-acetyltransferase [Streptomyces sp. t39]TXS57253.1 N-acetyltransferase [Streptomyces sp. t39]
MPIPAVRGADDAAVARDHARPDGPPAPAAPRAQGAHPDPVAHGSSAAPAGRAVPGARSAPGDAAAGPWGPALLGPAPTPAGDLHLVPVVPERDLDLLAGWMNDPAVAAYWELAGPASVTLAHLRAQLAAGHSTPCLGVLGSTAMSYFEIYRADLDPLARHYPARPHDVGVHVLIGGSRDRGRGVGSVLLRAVADLVLDSRPRCTRVVAEPDVRNTPSVSAFLTAGFRFSAELALPGKRAALMIRERALRGVL